MGLEKQKNMPTYGNMTFQILSLSGGGFLGLYALELKQFPGLLKIGSAFDVSYRISGLSASVPVDFECMASHFQKTVEA